MLLYLVRHGETDDNSRGVFLGRRDPPLNATGQAQATALAGLLRERRIDLVITSDLARARQTAEHLARASGAPLRQDPRLAEFDLGELDGLTSPEAHARFPEVLRRWRERPTDCRLPGGERLVDVRERMAAVFLELSVRHQAKLEPAREQHGTDGEAGVVMVSHTFSLLTLLCYLLEIPLHKFRVFHLDTGTLSIVRHGRIGGPPNQLLLFNLAP